MAATTATWAIPYPQGLDRFCDGHLFTEAIAQRTDDILAAFDLDLDLLGDMPAAKLINPVPSFDDIVADPRVVFTGIEYDNDGMISLAADPTIVSFTRNGYWIIGGVADYLSFNNAAGQKYDAELRSSVSTLTTTLDQETRDNGGNQAAFSTMGGLNRYTNFGVSGLEGEVQLRVTQSPAVNTIMFLGLQGAVWARWIGEI